MAKLNSKDAARLDVREREVDEIVTRFRRGLKRGAIAVESIGRTL
jgi:hypothetical protein